MGLSVVCGAVTTIAASSVLLLCRLQIFAKFGLIVSANTALSLILTLFFFCPVLLMFGPLGSTGDVVVFVQNLLGKFSRGRSSSLDTTPSAQHLLSSTDTATSGLPTEENVSVVVEEEAEQDGSHQ
jgi:protein dispatched 1